jgi:hypothetical protein
MNNFTEQTPRGWLAFELNVLRRLRFRSVVNPLAGSPALDAYLKRWNVRVSVNDPSRWAWIEGVARVENNDVRLTPDDFGLLLEDVYVPRHRLRNPALRGWFGESDAWWFDNYRENVERLSGDVRRAVALDLGMAVGDYALSFDEETRELRQPFSRVLLRLHESQGRPFDNKQRNASANKDARRFLADERADLLFLRLPAPARTLSARGPLAAWREEWLRGGSDFWPEFESERAGQLAARAVTRQQHLRFVEELLEAASHFKQWAVSTTDGGGGLPTEELVETLRRQRKVETVYTKDFSELTGMKAVIITAS